MSGFPKSTAPSGAVVRQWGAPGPNYAAPATNAIIFPVETLPTGIQLIGIVCNGSSQNSVSSIAVDGGGTPSRLESAVWNATDDMEWWLNMGATAGNGTATGVLAAGNAWSVTALEIYPATNLTVGIGSKAAGISATPSITITPAAAGDLIVAMIVCANTITGFTSTQPPFNDMNGTSHLLPWAFPNSQDIAWIVAPSTAPVTFTWTQVSGVFQIIAVDLTT